MISQLIMIVTLFSILGFGYSMLFRAFLDETQ